jgi:acyl carrier protein
MTEQEVLTQITQITNRMLADKGLEEVTISRDTELLGGEVGIDSLDLATLVRELEEFTGFDPFANGFIDFQTAGQLAKLYIRSA